jgi:hypothetical protein
MFYYIIRFAQIIKKIINREIKLKFGIPKKIDIVVYNSDSINQLQYVLEKKNYIIIFNEKFILIFKRPRYLQSGRI